jgi:hypothetical protein
MDAVSSSTDRIYNPYDGRQQQQGSQPSVQDAVKGDGQEPDQAALAGAGSPDQAGQADRTSEQSRLSEGERLQGRSESADQNQEEETSSQAAFGSDPEKGQAIDLLV